MGGESSCMMYMYVYSYDLQGEYLGRRPCSGRAPSIGSDCEWVVSDM